MLRWFRRLREEPQVAPPSPAVPREKPDGPAFKVVPSVEPGCSPALIEETAALVVGLFHASRPGPDSFPSNAARILDVVQRREPDFNQLVRVVSQDAAIAARLLQIANSPLYAPPEEVRSVRAAALRLGLREVGEIAMGLAGRSLFEPETRQKYLMLRDRWDGLFHQSMTAAFAAGALALRTRAGQPDCAFLAGMFHDIGKLIALRILGGMMMAGTLDPAVAGHGLDEVIERVHVEIGCAMTQTWSLPEYLCSATGRHHEVDPPHDDALVHVVRVIDGLHAAHAGALTGSAHAGLVASAALLGLDASELRVGAVEYARHAERVALIFGVHDPAA